MTVFTVDGQRSTVAHSIILDLAAETGRRCANLPLDFAQKMARRIQRKFKVKVAQDEITILANQYVEMYRFAALALKESLLPHTDIYTSLSHIDDAKFMGKLAAQFPAEDAAVLNEIAHWVIQYEYLR